MDGISIGIITAPRQVPTLTHSVRSLRKYLPDSYFNVFAEPGEVEIDSNAVNVFIHRDRQGALRNYDTAMQYLYEKSTKPYIWVTEDDYLYNASIVDRLVEVLKHDQPFGYFNMFTNSNNPILGAQTERGWLRLDLGWPDAWGVSYVFRREVIKDLRGHEFYRKSFETTDRNIDAVISETLKRMGLAMYYHNPSPSCTFGITSTLGHSCKTDGLNFKL